MIERSISSACRELLLDWWMREGHHPLGPANPELFNRVKEVMQKDPDETDERTYIVLANAVREVAVRKPGDGVTHSEDFRSVRWYGSDYIFSPMQAACVRVLWEAWERGSSAVGQESILEAVNSTSSGLRDIFGKGKKAHPAMGRMIVSPRKGAFQLADPS